MLDILCFIQKFKDGFNECEIEKCFTQGNCYHFAVILNNLYNGIIVEDMISNHFMFLHEYKFYDITGEINPNIKYLMAWDMFQQYDELWYNRKYKHCVSLELKGE